MYKKKNGFTLFEMIISISVATVLLLIATDRFITSAIVANNRYNQNVDLQTGVKNSVDNVKKILKKSVQIHLVGKEVYKPDMNLKALDEKYNYIAFREENGHRFLANIVYNTKKKQFDVIPLTASEKIDIMHKNDIKYELSLYRDDNNYKNKLEKNMINFTVKGVSKTDEIRLKNKEFELTESMFLPNVNQILISRHLQGGLKDITAIAYDDGMIKPGQNGGGGSGGNVGIVFIIDGSSSMAQTLDGHYPTTEDGDNFTFLQIEDAAFDYFKHEGGILQEGLSATSSDLSNPQHPLATRKVIVGEALEKNFLNEINKISVEKNIDTSAYIFSYHTTLMHGDFSNPNDKSEKYFYNLSDLEEHKYGPYKLKTKKGLEDAIAHVKGACDMKFTPADHKKTWIKREDRYDWSVIVDVYNYNEKFYYSTNTGLALLQGLEILHQLKDRGIENRFLVLLTDGNPSIYTSFRKLGADNYSLIDEKYMINREKYNSEIDNSYKFSTKMSQFWNDDESNIHLDESFRSIDYITDPKYGNNIKGLYKKAYLVGFSNRYKDKSQLGYPDENGNIPKVSTNAYLRRAGNDVEIYDSSNKTSLDETLKNIVKDIGVNLAVFDGPNKMKTL